jgi:hypothetical protein
MNLNSYPNKINKVLASIKPQDWQVHIDLRFDLTKPITQQTQYPNSREDLNSIDRMHS